MALTGQGSARSALAWGVIRTAGARSGYSDVAIAATWVADDLVDTAGNGPRLETAEIPKTAPAQLSFWAGAAATGGCGASSQGIGLSVDILTQAANVTASKKLS